MGRMRPTLTVSSATAFAEANARAARAVSAHHIDLSSNLFDISVAHGGFLAEARACTIQRSADLAPSRTFAVWKRRRRFGPSFHQRDDPRRACVAPLDLLRQPAQHRPLPSH